MPINAGALPSQPMRLLHCACGTGLTIPGTEHIDLPAVPTRKDLRFLDELAKGCLGEDEGASLSEIQAQPDVAHLGAPQLAPQQPDERLRVIVSGTDAALGAVLTRMMRADYLWAEVAYVPTDPTSPAAICWGIPAGAADAATFAAEAPVVPAACVRTDAGQVVAGSASIYRGDGSEEFVGEIIVDSDTLVLNPGSEPSARFYGTFGARLVPTMREPGIACSPLTTPLATTGRESRRSPQHLEWLVSTPALRWLARGAGVAPGQTDSSRVLTGRAVQAGGESISLLIDATPHPRPLTSTTLYRHLRDMQSVREP